MHQALLDHFPAPPASDEVVSLLTRKGDEYETRHFTEETNRELAKAAQWLHASGYNARKFVLDEAVEDDGLAGDLDHSRGPSVDYYITARHYEGDDEVTILEAATLRKKSIEVNPDIMIPIPSDAYKWLPGVRLSGDHISQEGIDILSSANPSKLKEITALATRKQEYDSQGELINPEAKKEADPLAVYNLIRTVIHEALGKGEVWFFAIVDQTHDSLVENFGEEAVKRIGDDFDLKDPLVREGIRLRPAVTRVDSFIRDIFDAYQGAIESGNRQQAKRFGRSFVFFSEGLEEDKLDPDLIEARDELLGLHEKQAS